MVHSHSCAHAYTDMHMHTYQFDRAHTCMVVSVCLNTHMNVLKSCFGLVHVYTNPCICMYKLVVAFECGSVSKYMCLCMHFIITCEHIHIYVDDVCCFLAFLAHVSQQLHAFASSQSCWVSSPDFEIPFWNFGLSLVGTRQVPGEIVATPPARIECIKCPILVINIVDRRCRGPFMLSLKCREGLPSSVFIFNIY